MNLGHVIITSLCQGLYIDAGLDDIKIARHIIVRHIRRLKAYRLRLKLNYTKKYISTKRVEARKKLKFELSFWAVLIQRS